MKNRFWLSLFLLGWLISTERLPAQRGVYIDPQARSVEIPFEYRNNFIILHLLVNGQLPLSFILDTGAGHTILTKKEVAQLLRLPFERSFQVMGSDLTRPLQAHLARGIRLDFPGLASAPQEDVLVLEEDFFQFESFTGIPIHGILTANLFSRYLFKINYDKRTITLYNRPFFSDKLLKGYQELPIELFRDKPYLYTQLKLNPQDTLTVKLLLDTGAGIPLLLFSDTHPLLQPPSNAIPSGIGIGLGGNLQGFMGRAPSLQLGGYTQHQVITAFQTLDSVADWSSTNHRNGLAGNELLGRFSLIFDYYNEKLYLKPAKRFRTDYRFDRSGITVFASIGENNQTNYYVQQVLPNSPAQKAGIQKGDQIIRIGRTPAHLWSLSGINRRLQSNKRPVVRLRLLRGKEYLNIRLTLEDLL